MRVVWQPGHMDLEVFPCRSLCAWVPTRRSVFACRGCGSQWHPREPWTPIDADGTVPAEVRRARERVTTARGAGAAGTGGT